MAPNSISLDVPYIKATHKKPYPAISPLRPELSQAGRTVVVVGGSAGIGFAIARAFVQASSSHLIITGRRETALASAVSKLQAEAKAGTIVSSVVSDLADLQATERLWDDFAKQGIEVDVLVLNAMTVTEGGPLVQTNLEGTWKSFETNVRGLLDYSQRFSKQGKEEGKVS
jgi:short-subunit dehydrogenase